MTKTFAAKTKAQRKAQFLEVLEQNLGNVSAACKLVGISRVTAYTWKRADPSFSDKWDGLTEVTLDVVENALMNRILDGDTKAIIYYLNNKGKRRGYGVQIDLADLTVSRPKAVFIDEDGREIGDEV